MGSKQPLFAIHRDQGSHGITLRSHQNLTHAMPNALAPQPQNQSNVSPNVSWRENATHLGKGRRDEPPEHDSVDDRSPVFKRPFQPSYPSTTTLPESAIRATTQIDTKMASAHLQQRQLSGPHTPTKVLEWDTSQSSETSISRLGPVIPPAYLALPGFNDPRIFGPAAEVGNTSPRHGHGNASANSGHGLSVNGDRSRNPVVEAHSALQQALFTDGPSNVSSGQGLPPGKFKAVDN